MKNFMDTDFLLDSETEKQLFFDYAESQPIFDWHCHLSPNEILENRQPLDLCELWLGGDHYKWRAMRSAGVNERFITGDAPPFEKFSAYAKTLSLAVGNPLVHWSHLELQRYFGIERFLCERSARDIWEAAQKRIDSEDYRPQTLIKNSNVFALCTTDDPADSLDIHKELKRSFPVPVLPAFRPDKAINIETHPFAEWVEKLGEAADISITDYESFKAALCARMDAFKSAGCVASDQSVDRVVCVRKTYAELDSIFKKAKDGESLSEDELLGFKFETLLFLGKEYAKRGFAMELHLGALRNNNSRMFRSIGADAGFDSIDDKIQACGLSRLLDAMDVDGLLPKTILFCLNPSDTYVLGAMLGNFQNSDAVGKIQLGSGWWFNDNIDGMTAQLKALGNLGVLGTFVGMVTDSRSFLSYPRHEYFRRILCHIVGSWVDGGLFPADDEILKTIIEGISFKNSEKYFLGD